jgi:hypothetical protein
MEKYLYPALLIISIAAMMLYLYKTHTRWLGAVCVRAVCGIVAILVLNAIFGALKLNCNVGVNAVTISAIGFLGVPGLILSYGVVYFFLHS